jgi:hypothetical protein
MADKVFRLTLSALAASVTLKPNGSKQSLRSTSPGWGGLCINIVSFHSMVIFIIYSVDVFLNKAERNPPISADPYRPSTFPIAFQLVQPETWQIHIPWSRSHVEPTQNQTQPVGVLGVNPGLGSHDKKPLQTFVLEAENH